MKEVVERVEQQTPVKVCKMVAEERVRIARELHDGILRPGDLDVLDDTAILGPQFQRGLAADRDHAVATGLELAAQLEADAAMTMSGDVLGTLRYMSPEQIHGDKEIDGRSDIYSLGAVFYELLSGRRTFATRQRAELLDQIADQGLDALPELIRTIINTAMQIERQNHLGVGPYERSPERRDHANGYKPRRWPHGWAESPSMCQKRSVLSEELLPGKRFTRLLGMC